MSLPSYEQAPRLLLKVILLDPNKAEIMFMIFFGIKYHQTDISGFFRSNSNLQLYCFMICHVYADVSKYKMR